MVATCALPFGPNYLCVVSLLNLLSTDDMMHIDKS